MIDNMPRLFYKWVILQVSSFCKCKTVCPDVRCMAANAFWEVARAFSLVARWFFAEFSPHSIMLYYILYGIFTQFIKSDNKINTKIYTVFHSLPAILTNPMSLHFEARINKKKYYMIRKRIPFSVAVKTYFLINITVPLF